MPKSIIIEPEKVFARSTIHFSDIPVNAYQRTMEEELAAYSPEDFLNIWQDMCAIREFETILNEIKTKGAYKGVAYNHAGPAHLSIGQEAAAVGMAFSLTPDDHIFGSHRSHGEILAKGFSAIRQLSEAQLLEIMESYRDGALLRPGGEGIPGNRERAWPCGSSSMAPTAKSSRGRPASTAAWAAPCTPSSRPSESIPTTPSWAAPAPSRRARRSTSGSIASRGSWCAISATPPSAAVRCGKASPSPPWTSTASCGTSRWAAACRSCSTA